MAEKEGFKLWTVIQAVTGTLVVASILGLAGSLVGIRDSVLQHELLIGQLTSSNNEGKRYTARDGTAERDARITADSGLTTQANSMLSNQIRYSAAFRGHIAKPSHQGSLYRFQSIEEDIEDMKQMCDFYHNGNGKK